ncbi:hypothetical protein GCM10027275_17620 [Rhabdobacter roseus]|uniref:Uncharacterized protein n=1 Tax=Rhabdobacter roseus TaxID=1655419 RepID=A0A840THQ5_9BACT|nr:hypothetical protein [Rhabdobacter roseus]MBB5283686.1 hypothetical protein [Rhabdobacter roseus]
MKKIFSLLLILLATFPTFAHVGSSGVLLQGQAGPYRVLVNVQPPDVIPGTAKVTVFVENGGANQVQARPIYFRSGDEGAPTYDDIPAVAGQLGQFDGIVWLMEWGSSSVQVVIDGDKGKGELVIPIVAVSTAERDMPVELGIGLGLLGLLLVLLLVTVIGASVSDGLLRPGQHLTPQQKRKRWINMGIATVVCGVVLYTGSSWWDSWAADYRQWIYKPLKAKTQVAIEDGQRVFSLQVDTTNWKNQRRGNMLSYLVPDHGKLMHLFLVRVPGLDAFAHLHPERRDSTTFQAYLPKLPAGKYLVYADVVQYSGFAETIMDTVEIPALPRAEVLALKKTDDEDTYVVTAPLNNAKKVPLDENVVICGLPGTRTQLTDGSYVVWEGTAGRAFEAGKPYQLSFEVFDPDGKPATLEPYLGMPGHAAIVRSDGSVYIHLHPTGTYVMAAEQSLTGRIADTARTYKRPVPAVFRDSIDRYLASLKTMPAAEREKYLMQQMGMTTATASTHTGMEHGHRISFPYAFPKEGQYRIFLQIKRNGQVITSVFDARVTDSTTL